MKRRRPAVEHERRDVFGDRGERGSIDLFQPLRPVISVEQRHARDQIWTVLGQEERLLPAPLPCEDMDRPATVVDHGCGVATGAGSAPPSP